MESSVNFSKGYTKVNPSESINSALPPLKPTTRHNRRTPIVFSLALLSTVLIGAFIASVICNSARDSPLPPSSSSSSYPSKAADSIKSVCSVTQYPNSCFTSISSIYHNSNDNNKSDPELIFGFSLQAAAKELTTLSSLPKTLISKSNDRGTESALRDCATLFDDSLSQLNNSVKSMRVEPGEMVLTDDRINDLKTWISAAMSGQETCLDGLDEMGSTAVDEVRAKVQRSKEYMSNSLAILSNIHSLLEKFGLTLH